MSSVSGIEIWVSLGFPSPEGQKEAGVVCVVLTGAWLPSYMGLAVLQQQSG